MFFGKNFFRRISFERQNRELIYKTAPIRDRKGNVHVPMYSSLFSELRDDTLCTNGMYAALTGELLDSISMYDTDETIEIDIFENNESTEFNRTRVLLGFKRYLAACYGGFKRQHRLHNVVFLAFLIVGVFLIYLMEGVDPKGISNWVKICLEQTGCVFIWQFVGYVAFELHGELKNIERYFQLMNLEFNFKHWE